MWILLSNCNYFFYCLGDLEILFLWLATISLLMFIVMKAYLKAFSDCYFYQSDSSIKKFSIFDLQLPFRKKKFKEILMHIQPKTSIGLHKSLQADYFFMPFAYGTLLFIFAFFNTRLPNLGNLNYKYLWMAPLIAYAFDIAENKITKSLLDQLDYLRKEKTYSLVDKESNKKTSLKLIIRYRTWIYFVASIKWVLSIGSILYFLIGLYPFSF